MSFVIEGEYTKAVVMLSKSHIEEATISQIQEMVDHPAFDGRPIVIQPDTHPGAGSVIGFTMELGERIVPNIVGVDVGCGLRAVCLGDELPFSDAEREMAVRDAVPMGRDVNSFDDAPHLVNEFDWGEVNETLDKFSQKFADKFGNHINPVDFDFDGYGEEYFKSLCHRVLQDSSKNMNYIIKGAGTLGGGNHFVEFTQSEQTGKYWLVLHSGSRYIGKSIAEYWQQKAIEIHDDRPERIRNELAQKPTEYYKFCLSDVSDSDLLQWVQGGMGEDWKDMNTIRNKFENQNPEKINETKNELNRIATIANEDSSKLKDSLDWLEGRRAHGYYVDMIFAQHYALFNRRLMTQNICDALDVEPEEEIESTHNYISFEDMVVRKGATPAHKGDKLVIPLNMAEGTLLCEGQGNEDWLWTAPHGAGRILGRREAEEELNMGDFRESMEDVYSESIIPGMLEESPQAYKDAEVIKSHMEPTAEIIDHLKPVHNIKAND